MKRWRRRAEEICAVYLCVGARIQTSGESTRASYRLPLHVPIDGKKCCTLPYLARRRHGALNASNAETVIFCFLFLIFSASWACPGQHGAMPGSTAYLCNMDARALSSTEATGTLAESYDQYSVQSICRRESGKSGWARRLACPGVLGGLGSSVPCEACLASSPCLTQWRNYGKRNTTVIVWWAELS